MARTLNELNRDWQILRELVANSGDQMDTAEHNMATFAEHLVSGSTELGLRLQALAAVGVQHTTLPPYLTDARVAEIVRELIRTRDQAKVVAEKATALGGTFAGIEERMLAFQSALHAEITVRDGKRSSRLLGLNQSVNAMRTLVTEVDAFVARDSNYGLIANFIGTRSPAQFDRLYDRYTQQALTKGAQATHSSNQESKWMQSLTLKVITSNHNKAQAAVIAIQQAGVRAAAAAQAHNAPALAKAQKDGKLTQLKLRPITEAYAAAMQNDQVQAFVKQSKERTKVEPLVKKIAQCAVVAQRELTKMVRLKA